LKGTFVLTKKTPYGELVNCKAPKNPHRIETLNTKLVPLRVCTFGTLDCLGPGSFKNQVSKFYLTSDDSTGHIVWINFKYVQSTVPPSLIHQIKKFFRSQRSYFESRNTNLSKNFKMTHLNDSLIPPSHDSFNTIKQLKKRDDYTISNAADTGMSTENAVALRGRIFGGAFGVVSGNQSKVRNLAAERLSK
jgi:hypothetical protein